tara:strand:- start:1050 stop:1838 length:789 start_codon:yes stop_codon:yes gene_type:complete
MIKIIKKFLDFFGYNVYKKNNFTAFQNNFFPIEIDEKKREIIKSCEQYSMTGKLRMSCLIQCLDFITQNSLQGDVVECGVWKGGNLILAQKYLNILKDDRKIIGFDTFEGMSQPLDIDVQVIQSDSKFEYREASKLMQRVERSANDGKNIWAYCDLETVKKNISSLVSKNNIQLIKGKVEETLNKTENHPEKISILRLDTDFYESTKVELEVLFPKLISGGFLIIDDYGHWKGARKAVDEYFRDNKQFLHVIDSTCRLIIKK